MHTLLKKINNFFQTFRKCISGRDQNVYRVWFFIVISVFSLIIISIGIVMYALQSPTEEELFLLVESDSKAVLNRGLLDKVLEFYNQKEAEFQSIKDSAVKISDPAR